MDVAFEMATMKFPIFLLFISHKYSDILAAAIRLCVFPIDFSIYATCPRAHENNRELSVSLSD